jgi:hypothetical protein
MAADAAALQLKTVSLAVKEPARTHPESDSPNDCEPNPFLAERRAHP